MAAVIASVSLHQETKNVVKLKKQVGIHKSNYSIPSFDRRFHPLQHNIFFKRFVFIRFLKNTFLNLIKPYSQSGARSKEKYAQGIFKPIFFVQKAIPFQS